MIFRSAGLATHIMNNQIKSVLLLAGFPVLLMLLLGGFFVSMNALTLSKDYSPSAQSYYTSSAYNAPSGSSINWNSVMQKSTAQMIDHAPLAIGAAAIWFIIAWFFHGRMISAAAGSKPVTRAQMPKIYNMLENLCISRGIAMPKFEVIDSPALNAFAAGINEKTYKIVLTRGIIESLQDDELEAVIAHELSHILNRDVRLLIISVIFVGMISFMAEMAWRSLRFGARPALYSRSNSREGAGGVFLVMLIGAIILGIGYMFALVLRFALSRKREYLADAGAVELTRNPEAMMRALQRISGQDKVRGMPDEVQQMCIANSVPFMGMFATHPPIPKRIQALSEMTQTPIPDLTVSLRRPPSRPWDNGIAPEARPAPPAPDPHGRSQPLDPINPWGTPPRPPQ
ncbi:MAG: M48 family metallopeptidase [Bdellovibrionales bacterium]|jgi:heat shock protein HtpX|nr:M48 family metallopeptidase [Bdellovibrionales bacterium]